MSAQGGIINGHGDFLKTLILVELAKRLYKFIKPKIFFCVFINSPNIPYQASAKCGQCFTHLALNSVVWHLISVGFFALDLYFHVRAIRFAHRNF